MKSCVDHTKSKNTNENEPPKSEENLVFKLENEDGTEESQGASNAPVKRGGKTEKILTERNVGCSGSVKSGVRVGARNKTSRGNGVVRIKMVGSGRKHRKKASVDEEEWSLNPVMEKVVTGKLMMLKEVKGRIIMEKGVMENTMMENIQLRSVQELDAVNITLQVNIHHALEQTQENAPKQDTTVGTEENAPNQDTAVVTDENDMNGDTTVVPQMNEDGNSVSHVMTITEKQETVVCEIKEDAKSVEEKEEESTCVMKNVKNGHMVMAKDDITMKENKIVENNTVVCGIKEIAKSVGEKESTCVTERETMISL